MRDLILRADRRLLVCCGLGLAGVIGWGSFAYSAWSSRQLSRQVEAITAQRGEALEKYQRLERSAGELAQVEGKLGAARAEFDKAARMWAAAQQELAALNKRVDQARERVSQTGSIKQPEPAKRAAR
jgi:exonuclease VII small subunit